MKELMWMTELDRVLRASSARRRFEADHRKARLAAATLDAFGERELALTAVGYRRV
jgi:hypothetical protein